MHPGSQIFNVIILAVSLPRYRCTEAYPASSPRELGLEVGDVVYILDHSHPAGGELEKGWLYGFLRRTGKSGIFPSTFVEPL